MQSFHFKSPNSEILQYLLTKFVFNIHTYRSIDLICRFILSVINIFHQMTLFHILSLILFYHVSRQQSIVFALSSLYYYLKKSHQLELSLQSVFCSISFRCGGLSIERNQKPLTPENTLAVTHHNKQKQVEVKRSSRANPHEIRLFSGCPYYFTLPVNCNHNPLSKHLWKP